ncbi:MAG: DUF3365 domain-containing protein [Akkermansiaceae bacterium]
MKAFYLLALATSSCFAEAKPRPAELGPEIIAEASAKLIAALTDAIAKDGAASAIAVCSERAPEIAAEVGKTHGVTVRRASEKPRNSKNAATDTEKKLLAAFAADLQKKQPPKPQFITDPDQSTTLFAPIVISNPLCLQCHGAPDRDIAPTTLTAIQKLYPADKATGYKSGDLRGLWSVTFPAGN